MIHDPSRVVPLKGNALLRRYRRVRALSDALAAGLSDADAGAQSMPDAAPAKWHLGHATWFFEHHVLRPFMTDYREFDPRFSWLFSDTATGGRIAPATRGMLTRPSLQAVRGYRAHVDAAMNRAIPEATPEAEALIEFGCNLEERHQEGLVTDILHLFAQNPLRPVLWPALPARDGVAAPPMRWIAGREGAVEIGARETGFAFDVESPRHTQWLEPHRLANRLVTNGEWLLFMETGGYADPRHWQPDGWAWVRGQGIEAPLHWDRDEDGDWRLQFGLGGSSAIDIGAPVRNISRYEADAFARWAGARLPTEAEWESAAETLDPSLGTFLDEAEAVEPKPVAESADLLQMFGDLWEWTNSPFTAYPRFRPSQGAAGEYGGAFVTGQYVLKGGSCATPRGHVRASTRHALLPHQRWHFAGLRLARDD